MKKHHQDIKNDKCVVPQENWIPNELFQAIQENMPIPCVDILVLRMNTKDQIEMLLIKRRIYPEIGAWGLIGGRILKDESTMNALKRQAERELGVQIKIIEPWTDTNPFAVFNDHTSDVQKHFVALTYLVSIISGEVKKEGPEYSEAHWFTFDNLPTRFSFHHKKVLDMLNDYITHHSLTLIK